ncbi:hydroxycarboxylic acid receptor 2 [Perca flavescens]|uniref:hydroxycarboxylic acid receptor 2 n=1 Tax=Perca flavescens TaxID=8167 RepID=UPI00106EDC41|nr:hydroxycarboxylic acid receptor 2-like [Perca flavescens]
MDSLHNTTVAINETNIDNSSTHYLGYLILSIVMIIEMIVGLPANIVALWIFCFRMKCWKPHTLFLFNLVLADFLLLISVPFRINNYLRGGYWVFGQVWCRINLFMLAVNRSASIAFMTAVALNRYFMVVRPHHYISHMTLTQAGWLAGLMWTVVIVIRIPLLATNLLTQEGNVSLCRSFHSYVEIPLPIKVYYVTFIAEVILPWFLLLFCSAQIAFHLHQRRMDRQKRVRRAMRAVWVISLVFTVCFMPSILTGLGGLYIKTFHTMNNTSYKLITKLFEMCVGFTYLNSALDPVIYSFSSSRFRDALRYRSFVNKNVRSANNH